MDDIRFTMGVLNVSDAAHYLSLKRTTLQGWSGSDRDRAPILRTLNSPPGERRATFTLIAAAEAHALHALSQAGVRPHKIRPALSKLREWYGDNALVAPELATDGVDVLWNSARSPDGEGIIEGRTGQRVMKEIVEDYLQYVHWADDRIPDRLQLRAFLPHEVVIDPYRHFGQPYFSDSGVRVADIAGMLKADEDPEVVADEFDVDPRIVRTTARVALGTAA